VDARLNFVLSLSALPQSVQEPAISHLTTTEAAQAEKLIGSMLLFIRQREGEIYCISPQHAEEQIADRKAPTNALVVGSLPIHLRKHRLGNTIAPVVHWNQVWFGSAG